jgi:hypothetical protein
MRRWAVAAGMGLALTLAAPPRTFAQTRPDFSGTWRISQAKSSRNVVGNTPDIQFPSQLDIKQSATDIAVTATSVRQQPVSATYKLDGSKVNVQAPQGITETGEATLNGATLVITTRRSFSSPAGDVTVDFKEVWTVNGNELTIEKTRTQVGDTPSTQKAVYDKALGSGL